MQCLSRVIEPGFLYIPANVSKNTILSGHHSFIDQYVSVEVNGKTELGILTGASKNSKGTVFLILEQISSGSKVISVNESDKVQINKITSGNDPILNFDKERRRLEQLSTNKRIENKQPVKIVPRNNSATDINSLLKFIGHQVEICDNCATDCVVERGWLTSSSDITDKGDNGIVLTLHKSSSPNRESFSRMIHSANYSPHGITVRLTV